MERAFRILQNFFNCTVPMINKGIIPGTLRRSFPITLRLRGHISYIIFEWHCAGIPNLLVYLADSPLTHCQGLTACQNNGPVAEIVVAHSIKLHDQLSWGLVCDEVAFVGIRDLSTLSRGLGLSGWMSDEWRRHDRWRTEPRRLSRRITEEVDKIDGFPPREASSLIDSALAPAILTCSKFERW